MTRRRPRLYVLVKKNNTQTHRQRSVTQRDLFPPQKKNFFEIFSSLVTKRHTKRISVLERQRYARRIIRRTHTTKFSLSLALSLFARLFSRSRNTRIHRREWYSLFPLFTLFCFRFGLVVLCIRRDDGFYSLLFSKGLIIFQRQIRLQISASMYS
jgi:hypothetical protein